jgi:hypothetical protein
MSVLGGYVELKAFKLTDPGDIGDWMAVGVDSWGNTFTGGPIRIEPAEGFVGFYPTNVSSYALKASAAGSQPRIVYALSADKPIDIYVYDVRDLKVVYRRKYAAGQAPGGAEGYNEILWDGKTDFGTLIPNGSYVLQLISEGKMIGQTYFVVL